MIMVRMMVMLVVILMIRLMMMMMTRMCRLDCNAQPAEPRTEKIRPRTDI